MRGVHVALREHVRVLWGSNAEAVGEPLQLAITALLAEHTVVIAFDEEHINEIAADLLDLLGLILDDHAFGDRLGAAGLGPSIGQDGTDTATAVRLQPGHGAETGNVDARSIGCLHDSLSGLALDLLAIDGKSDCATHLCLPFIR